jgi:diguanylate cyclase (GGDEF)-like protein
MATTLGSRAGARCPMSGSMTGARTGRTHRSESDALGRRGDDRACVGLLLRALSALPQGRLLPEPAWRRRHRGIVVVLWLHVAGLVAMGLGAEYPLRHVVLDVAAVGVGAVVASVPGPGRRVRSLAAALGLVTASAMLVHFWDGRIEGHFHFFVVIPILALYQDWAPFLFALLYVVVHHGVLGALDPGSVYNHAAAIAHPWRWALIHAAFVLGASAACLVSWRGNEQLLHEPLTGLPGRAVFLHAVQGALEKLKRRPSTLAVLFVDLNRFKLLNDTLGHAFGDALLVAAADRLRASVRRTDTVARLGGDEFAILSDRVAGESDVHALAARVKAALDAPFLIDGTKVVAGASIGVALTTSAAVPPDALIADADAAMYRAKSSPAEPFVVFDERMRREDSERLATETSLHLALERDELRLVYQPIMATAGDLVGVEALLRWHHPERGIVSPMEFIPLAEQTGLIVPIGRWVLHEACLQATTWTACGPDGHRPYVSVNVSARQFAQPDFPATVAEVLNSTGLEPHRLGLEITETVLLEEAHSPLDTLSQLKTLGVRLLLDDFGTGYSSLAYLQRFPIDTLKIDRSFVAALREDGQSRAILAAVAGLGEAVGMSVVAEGVETADERDLLTQLGYDLLQGYYFSAPRPAEELSSVLLGHAAAVVP